MAAAIVEGAELASGAFVLLEEFRRGGVEGVGEDFGLFVAGHFGQVLEGGSEGEEFAERIPAQVILCGELLDVLRRGTAGPGFEESAPVHQRDDGQHLRAGADFEDGEKVGQVVAQDVAGHRNGVLAFRDTLEAEAAGFEG